MGALPTKLTNAMVNAASNFGEPPGQVHMIILALDYKKTGNPLTCTIDAKNVEKLAAACGVANVQVVLDEQCTKDNVKALIGAVGSQCGPKDCFVFYYSGHGTSMKDLSGDEKDGKDEAFCFVTPDGQITYESCMIDDDFADCVANAVPEDTSIVILTDCCHSGTIADLERPCWGRRKVISVTGCLDGQTSGDIGKGGIFTHSMLMAIDHLMRAGEGSYSVGALYNACLAEDKRIFNSAQDITIQTSSTVTPDAMAWPLIPKEAYKAPLSQAAEASVPAGADAGPQELQQNADLCAKLGISPQTLQYITSGAVGALPNDFQSAIKPFMPLCMAFLGVAVKQICG